MYFLLNSISELSEPVLQCCSLYTVCLYRSIYLYQSFMLSYALMLLSSILFFQLEQHALECLTGLVLW